MRLPAMRCGTPGRPARTARTADRSEMPAAGKSGAPGQALRPGGRAKEAEPGQYARRISVPRNGPRPVAVSFWAGNERRAPPTRRSLAECPDSDWAPGFRLAYRKPPTVDPPAGAPAS